MAKRDGVNKMAGEWSEATKSFMDAYAKEVAIAKQDGEYDDTTADPLPEGLYRWMCEEFLLQGNLFAWAWTMLQWACCCRCNNIAVMTLRDLTLVGDAIKATFHKTKADQAGSKHTPKHIYGNPLDPALDVNLALGCYLAVSRERGDGDDRVFLGKSVASVYAKHVRTLLSDNPEIVKQYGGGKIDSSHSIRKGASTCAATGTTAGPPVASLMRRGDWSMGILDRYFKFADAGDRYLGRMLALFDVHKPTFRTLPAHFKQLSLEDSRIISDAIDDVYGSSQNSIADRYNTCQPVLQRLLAALVYHEPWLRAKLPANHIILTTSLFSNADMIGSLRQLVTVTETDSYLTPSGIPPHVDNIVRLEDIIRTQQSILGKIDVLVDGVKQKVEETIISCLEQRAVEQGVITPAALQAALQSSQDMSATAISDQLATIRESLSILTQRTGNQEEEILDHGPEEMSTDYGVFTYDGKMWCLPKEYEFPFGKVDRITGFSLWMYGDKSRKIKPWRSLSPKMMSKKQREAYGKIRSFFQYCEKALGTVPPERGRTRTWFRKANDEILLFLQSRVQYVFRNDFRTEGMKLSTWHRYTKPANILKLGTASDKEHAESDSRKRKRRS